MNIVNQSGVPVDLDDGRLVWPGESVAIPGEPGAHTGAHLEAGRLAKIPVKAKGKGKDETNE